MKQSEGYTATRVQSRIATPLVGVVTGSNRTRNLSCSSSPVPGVQMFARADLKDVNGGNMGSRLVVRALATACLVFVETTGAGAEPAQVQEPRAALPNAADPRPANSPAPQAVTVTVAKRQPQNHQQSLGVPLPAGQGPDKAAVPAGRPQSGG